jgi:hypothetical protein
MRRIQMINTEYREALVEVLEIINHLEEDEKSKIPSEIVEFYEKNKSKTYIPNINFEEEDISKYNIKNKTREILAGIYIDYLCDDEKKKSEYIKKLRNNEYNYEEKKKKSFNQNTIFKNKQTQDLKNEQIQATKSMIKVEKQGWFSKILNKIKKILKK